MSEALLNLEHLLVIAKFAAPYGVRGWIKILSYAHPKAALWSYSNYYIVTHDAKNIKTINIDEYRAQGADFVAHLSGIDDRNEIAHYTNQLIYIETKALAPCSDGQYYWADLIGCHVFNTQHIELGIVDHLFHAAQDVMVLQGKRERMIPFINGITVLKVDIAKKQIFVDWNEDY